eukprot:s3482_g1.t1
MFSVAQHVLAPPGKEHLSQLDKHLNFLLGQGDCQGDGAKSTNMKLARAIAKGVFDEHAMFRSLTALLIKKADRMNRGHAARVTCSSHADIDPGELEELALALSLSSKRSSLLTLLGANPRKLGTVHLRFDQLPAFFCPPKDVLIENISKVLDILQVRGGRASAKRCDSREAPFNCCLLPRRPKDLSAQDALERTCDFWASATIANQGIPPLSMAHDNHLLQVQLTEIFLCIRTAPQHLNFLKDCVKAAPLPIPLWPYSTLLFKERFAVFGCNDPPHCQKNAVCGARSKKRLLRTSQCRVVLGHLRLKQLPVTAYQGRDVQSDREAAWVLNSEWDCWGAALFQFKVTLALSPFISSKLYTGEEVLENSISAWRDVRQIGEQAFRAALLFNEAVTGRRVAEMESTLRDWWESVGKSVLVRPRVQQPVACAKLKSEIRHLQEPATADDEKVELEADAGAESDEAMMPSMVSFVQAARHAEGILSPNMVFGGAAMRRKLSATENGEATLAAARRAWGLQPQRQSRATSWQEVDVDAAVQKTLDRLDVTPDPAQDWPFLNTRSWTALLHRAPQYFQKYFAAKTFAGKPDVDLPIATLPLGVETYIRIYHPSNQVPIYGGRKQVICLDFHQVLDRVRVGQGKGDLRLEGEHLNSHVIRILTKLSRHFAVRVVSYCCASRFRQQVRDCAGRDYIDRVIITKDRAGRLGKLAAVEFALSRGGRVLLGDEMGLGKTAQALTLASQFPKDFPLLVVCPSSLRGNWLEEASRWLPPSVLPDPDWLPLLQEEHVQIVRKGSEKLRKNARVVVVSYDLVAAQDTFRRTPHGRPYRMVICDEAHYLKSPSSQRSQAGWIFRKPPADDR